MKILMLRGVTHVFLGPGKHFVAKLTLINYMNSYIEHTWSLLVTFIHDAADSLQSRRVAHLMFSSSFHQTYLV